MALALQMVLMLASVSGLSAQDIVISDHISCPECRISISEVVTVGDTTGGGVLGEYGSLRYTSAGESFVQTGVQPGTILVFGSDGRYLRSIGRRGEGPGEYTSPRVFDVRGDSLWVFDVTGRITMVSSERVETRQVSFAPLEAIRLGDGIHVYSAMARTPNLIGTPLHVFDESTGAILRSFGNPGGTFDPADPFTPRRSIAPSGEREFWAAHLNQYVIDKWNVDGERLLRIEREAPWFESWRGVYELPRLASPPTVLHGVSEGPRGLLWVFHRVADRDWAPMPPAETIGSETRTSMSQMNDLWDTLIEVIDLGSEAVLARTRVPGHIVGLAGQNLFYTYREVGIGHPQYVVWRVSLDRNGRSKN